MIKSSSRDRDPDVPFMLMDRFGATLVVTKSVFGYKRPFNRKFVDVSFLKSSRLVASSVNVRVHCTAMQSAQTIASFSDRYNKIQR